MIANADLLAACHALAVADSPAALRVMALRHMMDLARAQGGILFGLSEMRDVMLPLASHGIADAAPEFPVFETERTQHPLSLGFRAAGALLEDRQSPGLAGLRGELFARLGRLLLLPGRLRPDAFPEFLFALLLPAQPPADAGMLRVMEKYADFSALMYRLFARLHASAASGDTLERSLSRADQERAQLRQVLPEMLSGRLVGNSAAMRDLRADIAAYGASPLSVLVSGETGAGKELVARELHLVSDRRHGPFIAVNIAAIPDTLLESELFGHMPGAFTGASGRRQGLIAAADQGTLFLDEIGDMAPALQAKLLRVLQEKRFRPLGSDQEAASDFRLVTATHRDLAADSEAGRFRRDLFYRISQMQLTVPPLRHRKEDIPALAAHFLAEIAQRRGLPVQPLDDAELADLTRHSYPGNVRELQAAVERTAWRARQPARTTHDQATMAMSTDPAPARGHEGLQEACDRFERGMINVAYLETGGDRRRMAERLKIPLRTLADKLRRYELGGSMESGA